MGRNAWRWRQLFRNLTIRNLKVKYQRSMLGFIWALLNPLLMVAILAAVFTHVVRIPMEHYVAFLLSSYFVWNFLMQTMSSATFMLTEHTSLIRSVAFPSELLVFSAVSSRMVEFLVEMGLVLAGLAVVHHHGIPSAWIWLPWLFLLQIILALSLSFPLAVLSVFYQDIQHMLPVVLTVLFYISPVFYPSNMVPEALRWWYMANPLAQLLTAYRTVIYEGQGLAWQDVARLTAAVCLAWGVGYAIFHRYKAEIAEVI